MTRRGFTAAFGASLASVSAVGRGASKQPELSSVWNLSPIYVDEAAWEAARVKLLTTLPGFARYKDKLATNASVLAEALTSFSDIRRTALRLDTYTTLKLDADQTSSAGHSLRQRASEVSAAVDSATAWVAAEVAAIGHANIEELIAREPRLARFAFTLRDTLRQAPHALSAHGELLARAGPLLDAPQALQRELVSSAIRRDTVNLTDGHAIEVDERAFATLSRSAVRADRKSAYDAYWAGYARLEDAFRLTLTAAVAGDVLQARARGFSSSRDAALFRLALPGAVYTTMLAEVHRGLPVLRRYYKLRRRALRLPDLHGYDLAVPLATSDRRFDLLEIRRLVLAAVRPLGRAYADRLAAATSEPWMDAYPRLGKVPGSYCNPGAYGVHPYVLLNLSPNYAGATAFAHEWGHAMHGVLASAAQPFDTFNAPAFVQEIASTCNEQFLIHHMLATARSREDRLFYLGQRLETFAAVFFGQALRAEFEAEVHRQVEDGQSSTGEQISQLYFELTQLYSGPQVVNDRAYAVAWARQVQYYDPFYVFQYVTALTGAVHFSRAILRGEPGARERYLAMLQAGGSVYGFDLLKGHGLDLASPEPYRAVIEEFTATLDAAEALLPAAS